MLAASSVTRRHFLEPGEGRRLTAPFRHAPAGACRRVFPADYFLVAHRTRRASRTFGPWLADRVGADSAYAGSFPRFRHLVARLYRRQRWTSLQTAAAVRHASSVTRGNPAQGCGPVSEPSH